MYHKTLTYEHEWIAQAAEQTRILKRIKHFQDYDLKPNLIYFDQFQIPNISNILRHCYAIL